MYSIDENAIKKNSHQFDNESTLRQYLNTFIDLINSDLSSIQKKTDLSNLMDKLIDWKKLLHKLKKEVIRVLGVNNNIMNNKAVIFHQIPIQKYDNIYMDVVKKQIETMDDELGQICGLSLTKES